MAKFKGNEEAISALLDRVERSCPSSSAGRKLRPSFFAEWPAADASAAGSSAITDDDETESATVGATTPLVLFCESMGVDPSFFLTAKVTGKASVITALTSFSNFGRAGVCLSSHYSVCPRSCMCVYHVTLSPEIRIYCLRIGGVGGWVSINTNVLQIENNF